MLPHPLRGLPASRMTGGTHHSTVMLIRSVAEKPLSPVQVSSMVPLAVATVWNAM
jgi:hypothetical protein